MSHPTFFDYGMRGESDQVVPVNPFRHSPAYLRPLPLFSSLIFLPSQFWDVSLDAFFSLLVSSSYLTPHGFTEDFGGLHFEELAEIQPEGWRRKTCSKAGAGRNCWLAGSCGWLWVLLGCKERTCRGLLSETVQWYWLLSGKV